MASVVFNGKTLREPAAAARLRIGVPPTVTPSATSTVLVVGPSEGGEVNKVYSFDNVGTASTALRGGDGLNAVVAAFSASPNLGGAGLVKFVRATNFVTPALTSTVNAGGASGIQITSKQAGLWTNKYQIEFITSGSNFRVKAYLPNTPVFTGLAGFSSVTNPTTVDIVGGTIPANLNTSRYRVFLHNGTAGIVSSFTANTENQITLSSASTITGVAQYFAIFEYTEVEFTEAISAANMVSYLTDKLGDLFTFVNLAVAPAAPTITNGPHRLVGGTNGGTVDITGVTNALNAAVNEEFSQLVVAVPAGTNSPEIDIRPTVQTFASVAESSFIAYLGSRLGATADQAKTYAASLNNGRVVYVYQSAIVPSVTGLSTEVIPPYVLAAKIAGLSAALPPETPITRKAVAINGLNSGANLSKVDREALLQSGVLHIYQPVNSRQFVVNQGITTLQSPDAIWDAASAQATEISLMRIVDKILYELRTSAARDFIGTASAGAKSALITYVESYLSRQMGSTIQSYRDINAYADPANPTAWYVEFGIVPNYPINFVLVVGSIIG